MNRVRGSGDEDKPDNGKSECPQKRNYDIAGPMDTSEYAHHGDGDASDGQKDAHGHTPKKPAKRDHEHAEGVATGKRLAVGVFLDEWLDGEHLVGARLVQDMASYGKGQKARSCNQGGAERFVPSTGDRLHDEQEGKCHIPERGEHAIEESKDPASTGILAKRTRPSVVLMLVHGTFAVSFLAGPLAVSFSAGPLAAPFEISFSAGPRCGLVRGLLLSGSSLFSVATGTGGDIDAKTVYTEVPLQSASPTLAKRPRRANQATVLR